MSLPRLSTWFALLGLEVRGGEEGVRVSRILARALRGATMLLRWLRVYVVVSRWQHMGVTIIDLPDFKEYKECLESFTTHT